MDCNGCRSVPYIVHEGVMVRLERIIRRLWLLLIILILLFVGTNIAWIVYENQFEEVVTQTEMEVQQDTEGGGSNYAVNGNFNGETDSTN